MSRHHHEAPEPSRCQIMRPQRCPNTATRVRDLDGHWLFVCQSHYAAPTITVIETMNTRAARMRHDPTHAEARLCRLLNSLDVPYDHQRVFGRYIVDVYLPGRGIAIEVDGGYHSTKEQRARDALRTSVLRRFHGVTVVRIPNARVFQPDFLPYLRGLTTSPSRPAARPRRSTTRPRRTTERPSRFLRRRQGVISALMSPETLGGRLEGKRTQMPGDPASRSPAPQEPAGQGAPRHT